MRVLWNSVCNGGRVLSKLPANHLQMNRNQGTENFMATKQAPQDPKEAHPQPKFPEQKQKFPGKEEKMRPKADHGEESYVGSGKLKDMKTIITGADSGIGRAVALAFAREGADVLISYYNEDDDAAETARLVEEAGRKGVRFGGDIGSEEHCKRIVQQAVDEFGDIDILVNNAAFQMPHHKLEEFTSEQFEHTYRVNLFSMFYLAKAAAPHMKEGSCIINTASIQAYDPSPELLDYASTKGAIVNFTKGLAKLLIKQGIRVNAVAPGPVWTPLIPMSFDEEKTSEFGKNTPIGRPAQPAELAPIYVLLASPEATYISGEVYAATGGKTPF
jgi:NAD(P)-dependent dehydrogenase (short-subunit alcohol dehydrogenase family)